MLKINGDIRRAKLSTYTDKLMGNSWSYIAGGRYRGTSPQQTPKLGGDMFMSGILSLREHDGMTSFRK